RVIANGLRERWTHAQIAVAIGKDPSTVSREIRRKGGPRSCRRGATVWGRPRVYQPERAQRMATVRAMRPKSGKVTGMLAAAVPGHWEGDLLLGGVSKGAVITLVERATRFVLLAPLPKRRDAVTVRDALTAMIGRLPLELRKSLTWDQGKEMAEHARFTVESG